jgi:hypothetical protein
MKKGQKIKHGNDVTCIVCLCVGRKTFFHETKFTNRETIVIPITDSSPIVGFRGRETYEVSKYTIWNISICIIQNCINTENIRFGNNQFV